MPHPLPVRTHPYAPFLGEVERPGRYVGGEHGTRTRPWAEASGRMVLAFPDTYEVGMSHMGTRILYDLVNRCEDLLLDRCMMPWFDLEERLRAHRVPLVSLEHARPLRDFHVVGFSLQFELTYTNVLAMLDLGGVAIRSADRGPEDPFVVAGGPSASHPEPLAPFIDAFFLGEAEHLLPELVRAWVALSSEGLPRADRLARLARRFPLYVPASYETEVCPQSDLVVVRAPEPGPEAPPFPVKRAYVADLDSAPFPATGPEPIAEAVFDRAGIEIARGCTEGCRFCQAGMIYRPVRERSPDSILRTLRASLELAGHDEISLTSLSTADYSAIVPLIDAVGHMVRGDRVALSVSSLRAYGLPERTLDALRRVRATGLTFAPEAGTQRLRDVINKNVSEEDMLESAARAFSKGWDRLKLYFMIGLPTETDDDIRAIAEVGGRVHRIGRRYAGRKKVEVVLSVSVHVPKPHTPFQWCAMDSLEQVARKQALLRVASRPRRIRLRSHRAEASLVECVLARGDRRVAEAVERAYALGCRFDGWDEAFSFERWLQAFEEAGVEPRRYLGTLPTSARLPWDHLDVGLQEGFLAREYRRALKGRYSPPCGKPFGGATMLGRQVDGDHRTSGGHHGSSADLDADARRLVCYDCGVACDLDLMRRERRAYLVQLEAGRPAASAEPPRSSTAEPRGPGEIAPPRLGARAPRPEPPRREAQGRALTLRLRYSRTAPAHLVGHRDNMRRLPRIFRRAGVTPFYTQGFSPRPVMGFGPTLPLGSQSLDEVLDIRLLEEGLGPLETLPERLSAASPPGIGFHAVERLPEGARSVAKAARTLETLVFVLTDACGPDPEGGGGEGLADLRGALGERVAAAKEADALPVEVVRKKGPVRRDARPEVVEIALDARPRRSHPFNAPGALLGCVRVVQRLRPTPTVRPDELVRALCASLGVPIRTEVLRTRIELESPRPPGD